MKRIRKNNPELVKLIEELSKRKENIWRDVASRLSKSRKNMAEVNVDRINRYAKEGETILVPGKVLAQGKIVKKVNVAAFKFSKEAKKKIIDAGGKCMSIGELLKENPKGSNVRIIG